MSISSLVDFIRRPRRVGLAQVGTFTIANRGDAGKLTHTRGGDFSGPSVGTLSRPRTPQVGVVGMTDEEATTAGHTCWCNTIPLELVPRAGAIRTTRGVIKMVADAETNDVLGVSMLGANAAEVIHEAAMGLRFHATIDDFIDLLHVYPTIAEALKIVASSRYKDPGKLS